MSFKNKNYIVIKKAISPELANLHAIFYANLCLEMLIFVDQKLLNTNGWFGHTVIL